MQELARRETPTAGNKRLLLEDIVTFLPYVLGEVKIYFSGDILKTGKFLVYHLVGEVRGSVSLILGGREG